MCFCTPTIRAMICNNCNKYIIDLQAQLKATQDELEAVKIEAKGINLVNAKMAEQLATVTAERDEYANEARRQMKHVDNVLKAVSELTRQRDIAEAVLKMAAEIILVTHMTLPKEINEALAAIQQSKGEV